MLSFLLFALSASTNVIIFIADDLGYDDLNSLPTPRINELANAGIRLTNHYVDITCTPSRASLFTGRYATNVGLPHVLLYNNPYGLSNHTTLPTVLQNNNYSTVGFKPKVDCFLLPNSLGLSFPKEPCG